MNKILAVCMIVIAVVAATGGFFLFRALEETTRQSRTPVIGQTLVPVSTQSAKQTAADKPKIYRQTIDIDSRAFSFAPNVFRVKMGEEITVTVMAYGDHMFVIDAFGVNVKTGDGQKTTAQFTPDKKGAFPYYCSYPGHRRAGQQGMLIVE